MILALLACAVHDLRAVAPGSTVGPDDDGPHDSAQTEWWHVHAELNDVETGEPLHLFAGFVVQRTDLDRVGFVPVPLGVNPFHAAYVRLADEDDAWVADRENFPDFFAAGFLESESLDLYHGDWRIRREGESVVLRVSAGPVTADLRLDPTRAATLPGDSGLVEMPPGSRHLWKQEEGMTVTGSWREGRQARWVQGEGFVKHQWGRMYDPDLDGFTWLSANLPGNRALSVGWLHGDGMSGVPGSRAWISEPDGSRTDLDPARVKLSRTGEWRSRRSGATWPVGWSLRAPGVDLRVEATQPDAELWVFPVAIWAGPARVTGTVDGVPIDVLGFAEQAGADRPEFRALFHSQPPPGTAVAAEVPAPESGPLVPWTLVLGPETEEAP
ncbi:MAG: hypothetical protein FJ102_08250 [Deltaproteobacteria bacterium]|nr:hypothetical protein [Deltaproteobacteria bacterium]